MIMVICAVLDIKAEAFSRPFFAQTTGAALRSFNDEVNRASEDNSYYKHPEDYKLFDLGTFDDSNGKIVSHEIPKLIIHAEQCRLAEINRFKAEQTINERKG